MSVWADNLAQQMCTAIAQLPCPYAELMPAIHGCQCFTARQRLSARHYIKKVLARQCGFR
ncbi:hypothetical protein D3C77_741710 [compost metagenome]